MRSTLMITTPIGELCLVEENGCLIQVKRGSEAEPELSIQSGVSPLLGEAARQLDEYFKGERTCFDLPLSPQGTEFQRNVWNELCRIPYGETRSYGEIARNIGKAGAARAIGMANHHNPIAIIIPCHRVIGADGGLVGYAGGLEMKLWLLEHEKQPVSEPTSEQVEEAAMIQPTEQRREHEVTVLQDLLDEKGHLREPGWGKKPVFRYQRKAIKACPFRIKEWDYYLIVNDHYGVALTIADNSYMGLISASILNFDTGFNHTETVMTPFPMGKFNMPESAETGDTQFENKRVSMRFLNQGEKRELYCSFQKFYEGKTLSVSFLLDQPFEDRMMIATPWAEDLKAFYYNQKINCMPAEGFYQLGEERVDFSKDTTLGTLDWGRGVWMRRVTWYWGTGSGWADGSRFGFNFGYGFGDTSAATENMVFMDGVAHKLGRVDFLFSDLDNYLQPWEIRSEDQRVELTFQPILDRVAKINALVISTDQHQIFGRVSGHVILDNGRTVKIHDLLCSFEVISHVF